MNTIILYASKYGCTADCAKYLESALPGSVSRLDMDAADPKTIDLTLFDTVVFGSSIYVGSTSKKMRSFCNDHIEILTQKKVGIFLCCGFSAQFHEYLSKNFPQPLLEHAAAAACFGGEARMDRLKLADKWIMKVATKGAYADLNISRERMDRFIRDLK